MHALPPSPPRDLVKSRDNWSGFSQLFNSMWEQELDVMQKQSPDCKIHSKAPVPESLFSIKFQALRPSQLHFKLNIKWKTALATSAWVKPCSGNTYIFKKRKVLLVITDICSKFTNCWLVIFLIKMNHFAVFLQYISLMCSKNLRVSCNLLFRNLYSKKSIFLKK